jgi:sortase (surface protein transpeptidase)
MPEHIIYHVYNSSSKPLPPKPQPQKARVHRDDGVIGRISKSFFKLALVFGLIGIGILVYTMAPTILAGLSNFKLSKTEIAHLSLTEASAGKRYLPPLDPRLPLVNRLSIPSIGVDTDIQEATYDNYEAALKKGVWRVSDFGAPGDSGIPVILAAHRFGYLAWSNQYRHLNSFYNLPKLKVGDTIEIIYQQRKYTYEVYSEGKGTEIMDYTADLVLYTCEQLTGEERIFKYARLIKI